VAVRAIDQSECRAGGSVWRIGGALPGGHVAARGATGIGSDLQIVIIVYVAGGARNVGVPVGQQESCGAVIEFCVQPGIEGMTAFACGRKLSAGVVRIRCLLIILQMARNAFRGKTLVLRYRRALVAIFALHRCVGAQQREAILVILDLLNGNLPPTDGVALRTVRAKPSAVNVRVAVRAIFPNIGEYRLDVTLCATHVFVHAAQRITCAAVIEFGNNSNGVPTVCNVTIFTRDCERTVRASGAFFLGVGLRGKAGQGEN
jgi:hypothetical protein